MQNARIKNTTVLRINPYALINTIIINLLILVVMYLALLSRQVIETKVVIDFPLHLFFIFVLFNHDGLGDILICVLQEIALLLFSLSSIFYHVFKVLTFGSENYWYILEIILFLLLFVIWGIIRLRIRFEIWIIRLLISHHRIELLFIPVFVNYKYHFIGSKNFDSQHDWCSLLSLENPSLFRWDMKNAAISSLVLNKWDINTWWQVLIQLDKFLFEEEKFLWFRCLFHLS